MVALLSLPVPVALGAAADVPTTVTITGGAGRVTQNLPPGQHQFGVRVPLRRNAENVLTVQATDTLGRSVSTEVKIKQISLGDIVVAKVKTRRLTVQEVRNLVDEGTIDIEDPQNYNVSVFDVVLTVNKRPVPVSIPVVQRKDDPQVPVAKPVFLGCQQPGKGLATTDNAVLIPCGGGGGARPKVQMIPFQIELPEAVAPGVPPIPGVILIEGKIKTLKEFFGVKLLLMNVSSLFTLTDIRATIEVPEGALTPIKPAMGPIDIEDLPPGSEGNGEFVVRGDEIGVHTVTVHFGGNLTGAFLDAPIPFSGSASTDLEVKGPPRMDVVVEHPDYVTAGEPYTLTVHVTNTDPDLPALYTSLGVDVGMDAYLLDPATGEPLDGPKVDALGDILPGDSVSRSYTVVPLKTGPITSCTAGVSQNLKLSVVFDGNSGPTCAVGTLPSQRQDPTGRPTVSVVPAPNTTGVTVDPAIAAFFSAPMITGTITTGTPEATFRVTDPAGNLVAGTLEFTSLFGGNTVATFRPAQELDYDTTYTVVIEPTIFSEEGLQLASGVTSSFTTAPPPRPVDTVPPQASIVVEPPVSASFVPEGQLVPVRVETTDDVGVERVDLFLDGAFVDTGRPASPVHFTIDTSGLAPGSSHLLTATAVDASGKRGDASLEIRITPDITPPAVAVAATSPVLRGHLSPVTITAQDNANVARVELFVDGDTTPVFTSTVAPYQFGLETSGLSGGIHHLHAVATDGAGNTGVADSVVEVIDDTTPPVIAIRAPTAGRQIVLGAAIPVVADITDDVGVASIGYYLDGEATPRARDTSAFTLDTHGLAVGDHTLRVVAADANGNQGSESLLFSLFTVPPDTTPPDVPQATALTASLPAGGVSTISGAAGAVEAGAMVEMHNRTTLAAATVRAAADGSFQGQIEAEGGESIVLVAVDAAGNRSATTEIAVPLPPHLTSISATPSPLTLDRSTPHYQLVVQGGFSDGTRRAITTGLTFVSANPTIATVTATGLVIGGDNGQTTVEVRTEGVAPVSVPVTVAFPTVVSVVVSPASVTLKDLGRTVQLGLQATLSDGTTRPYTGSVGFTTRDPSIAQVTATGLVTGVGEGSTDVVVTPEGLPPTVVPVTVERRRLVSLDVTPAALTLVGTGTQSALAVTGHYSDGTSEAPSGPVAFTSSAPEVATVDAAGVVTAVANGTATVTASYAGFTATVAVTVDIPPLVPPPEITSIDRPRAGKGDPFVIRGHHFAPVPADNRVVVNGLAAEVRAARQDELLVIVPDGATSGPVTVEMGGQVSNAGHLDIYPRRATSVEVTTAVDQPALPGDTATFPVAGVEVRPGDVAYLSSAPDLLAPVDFDGALAVSVDGGPPVDLTAGEAVDLTALLAPGRHDLAFDLTATGDRLRTGPLHLVVGPPSTGALVGERSVLASGQSRPVPVTFTGLTDLAGNPLPDGAKVAVTAHHNWLQWPTGGWVGSAGGTIVNGEGPAANDTSSQLFTVVGGRIDVLYDPAGAAPLGARSGAVARIQVGPADAAGNRIGSRAVAVAEVALTTIDTAATPRSQSSAVADGSSKVVTVRLTGIRDTAGNRVPDGAKVAVTARHNWLQWPDGGWVGSVGGTIVNGEGPAANDTSSQLFTVVGGAVEIQYDPSPVALSSGAVATANIQVAPADAAGNRIGNRAFVVVPVTLSSPTADPVDVQVVPASVLADGGDNRVVVTVSHITDVLGNPVPDGTKVAVTARHNWLQWPDGGWVGSAGGTIANGEGPAANDAASQILSVTGGAVQIVYSTQGAVELGARQTATARVQVAPADAAGNRIGDRAFAVAEITLTGYAAAEGTADPPSAVADGSSKVVTVRLTGIRDTAGNRVPDGAKVAVTARHNWLQWPDGGWVGSAGGTIVNGEGPAANDPGSQLFTVVGGAVEIQYDPSPVALSSGAVATANIQVAPADAAGNRIGNRAFVVVPVTLSSPTADPVDVQVVPASVLADGGDNRVVVTVSHITDVLGNPVPDGTKVAVTARHNWLQWPDGGWVGSAGGTIANGEGPAANDAASQILTVSGGAVQIVYSTQGAVELGARRTATARVQVAPADAAGNRIGNRAFAVAEITLTGLQSAAITGPGALAAGARGSYTVSDLRDTAGNPVPDGARVAVTARHNWLQWPTGGWIGSAGGTIVNGEGPAANDTSSQLFTVSGGSITIELQAPAGAGTTVLQLAPATPDGRRIGNRAFAVKAISITP